MDVIKCFLLIMLLFGVFPLSAQSQPEHQSGFISIDCGILHAYNHTSLGIYYVPDSGFIDTGVNHNISSKINVTVPNRFLTLRSFPDGEKSCYVLRPKQGKNNKYLIRAGFMYGNYDNKSDVPRFDLYLGVNWWDTVVLSDAESYWYTEIIYIADSDTINVCLVNTGFGTPFMSVLELRLLDNDTYVSPYKALQQYDRIDYGSDSNYVVRFPDDVYDRIWWSWYDERYELVNTSLSIESAKDGNSYKVPSVVMETAGEAPNGSPYINISYIRDDSTNQFYVYLYFAEVKELKANEFREFYVLRNDEIWAGPIVPQYLQTIAVYSNSSTLDREFDISIFSSENSTLPPLLNAYEIYCVKEFLQSETYHQDVDAIMHIKSFYNLTKYWQGDPCGPDIAVWEGLNCSYNKYDPPRIISVNLSSSGLRGAISPFIANLTMLKYLDLSNNSLTGPIPDFLTRLKYLTVLNLDQNKLSGPIPKELTDKLHSGLLSMSARNKKNCSSYICKHKVVVPLIATIAVVFVILTVLTTYWSMNRRNQAANAGSIKGSSHDGALRSKERQLFAYSEVVDITKNMESVIGNGNLGTVYHGRLDDIPVAVKIFHPSHANKQFQANARLITRVHHRQLTSCFGYFDDSNCKGLIYEFMPNGSLEDILSGKHSNLLSWQERIQIAMDVAQGLHYLHNSCKPPIIHGNLKPTNILLNEKNQSKLVDFGLSAILTKETGSTQYIDPEYYVTNKFTERSDVYSFGTVFLSLITNQSATTNTGDITQRVKFMMEKGDIRNVVDPRLKDDDFYIDSAWKAVEIAMACASQISAKRPPIKLVVMELNQCLAMEISRISRATGTVEMLTVNLNPSVIPQPR